MDREPPPGIVVQCARGTRITTLRASRLHRERLNTCAWHDEHTQLQYVASCLMRDLHPKEARKSQLVSLEVLARVGRVDGGKEDAAPSRAFVPFRKDAAHTVHLLQGAAQRDAQSTREAGQTPVGLARR